ncbi:MAG TPA: DUF3109 family protein [Ignavibacteria bacterium]|nr:DUF3109 family protein [Ignavibacteria bacterium]
MIDISKYIIDDRIFSVKFKCNLGVCKGACCTMYSELGAPILEKEIDIIRKNVEAVSKYLKNKNMNIINSEGFYIKYEDKYYLNNVNDRDCVFSLYENGVAKCSFEKAFYKGEIHFRKPISCSLFPIRISGDERNILRYEKFSECSDALTEGEKENVTIYEFVKDGLINELGEDTYNELKLINKN